MSHYKLMGWEIPTCQAAAGKFHLLMQSLSASATGLCLEAHFSELELLHMLGNELPSSSYACYCWKRVAQPGEFRDSPYRSLGKACLRFANRELSVAPSLSLPAYGWDGKPSRFATITYTENHIAPIPTESRQPNEATLKVLGEIANTLMAGANEGDVKLCRSWSGGNRSDSFLLRAPTDNVPQFLEMVMAQFSLADGIASFEFLGSINQIEAIYRSGRYAFSDFPKNSWSLNRALQKNGQMWRAPFALGRDSLLYPVVNMESNQLPEVARVLDGMGEDLTVCSILQKSISWNLGSGRLSPKTLDNYAMLSKQRKGYGIFIGFEQYADEDPPLKEFKAAVVPIIEHMGAKLKSVSYAG